MNPRERKVLLSLIAIYLARMLGLFLLFPVWALFVEQYQFPAYWMAAALIGLYGLTQALMQIPMGLLSDRIGRRSTLALGMGLLGAGALIAAIADSAAGLLIGRLLQGCGATSAVAMAVVADEISPEHRIKATALIGASIGVSFALAMLLSPLLAAWFSGLRPLFALSAALALVAGLMVMSLPPRSRQAKSGAPEPMAAGLSWLQRRLCLGIFMIHASLSAVFLRLPGLLADIGLAARHHGWLYFAALLLIAPLLARRVRAARGPEAATPAIPLDATLALLLAWLAIIVYAPALSAGTPWALGQLAAIVVVYFYGFTLLEAVLPAAFMSEAPEGRRGLSLGFFTASQFMGSFAGGLAVGLARSESALLLVHGGAMAIVLLWALSLRYRSGQSC